MKKREHTISGLVNNAPGVLLQITGIFTKEKINIKSLAVGETEDPKVSRMTIVVLDDESKIRLAENEIRKIKEVIAIDDLTRKDFIDRELTLVKIKSDKENMPQIMQIVEIFRANIVGFGKTTITVEMTGDEEKINGIIKLLMPFGIKSLVRTGKIALKRGDDI